MFYHKYIFYDFQFFFYFLHLIRHIFFILILLESIYIFFIFGPLKIFQHYFITFFTFFPQISTFHHETINPIQKHPHVDSFACILYIFIVKFLFPMNFFWNMINSEAMKVCCIITIHIQSNPGSFYWSALMKI